MIAGWPVILVSKSRLSKSRSSKSRPSKMGRKWTQDDVLAYNIKIVYPDLETFFGVTDLPPPIDENNALTSIPWKTSSAKEIAMLTDVWTRSLLQTEPENRGPTTIGFIRDLLGPLRYADATQRRSLIVGLKLPFLASRGRPPQVDVCIRDHTRAILLVVRVDNHLRGSNPEPRLISDTIAAFHNDNIMRTNRLGTDPLTSKVMLGITMDGTMPTFYKIPVTAELVRAVESGERPEQETIVHVYRPEVPKPEEGMKPLDNRYIILSCFEAFKQFL